MFQLETSVNVSLVHHFLICGGFFCFCRCSRISGSNSAEHEKKIIKERCSTVLFEKVRLKPLWTSVHSFVLHWELFSLEGRKKQQKTPCQKQQNCFSFMQTKDLETATFVFSTLNHVFFLVLYPQVKYVVCFHEVQQNPEIQSVCWSLVISFSIYFSTWIVA